MEFTKEQRESIHRTDRALKEIGDRTALFDELCISGGEGACRIGAGGYHKPCGEPAGIRTGLIKKEKRPERRFSFFIFRNQLPGEQISPRPADG